MRVAAYQAPLRPSGSMDVVARIREQVDKCEAEHVAILCCPEAVLGGLADDAACPSDIAIDVEGGELAAVLSALASDTVTTIVGFTEIAGTDQLYNSAAILHRGVVAGVYRKRHPAIRSSVYQAGGDAPVFVVGGLTFGILICNDSNYPELARQMASRGATILFVPSNNGLPIERADVVDDARRVDIALARDNGAWVVRADVAGRTADLVSFGSSGIVAPDGTVVHAAQRLAEDLLVATLAPASLGRQRTAEVRG